MEGTVILHNFRCLTKKAEMSVSMPEVDFGPGVTLAESSSRTLTISNGGALDVEYSVVVGNEVGWKEL